MFVVATFYKIMDLQHFADLRAKLLKLCNESGIKGTILLAAEGINSTIAGDRESVNAFYKGMKEFEEFADISYNETFCPYIPFLKMKVKLKKEVVTIKQELDLNLENRGTYVDAHQWDELIQKQEAVVIDTRNDYEIVFGTFKRAIDPKTRTFTQFKEWVAENLDQECDKEKPIAMFCTGGIRCEKSTAYMKSLGFKNVYHLKGGILQYLKDVEGASQTWIGSCFVFDDRVAVDKNLTPYQKY